MTSAVSLADGSLGKATKYVILENLSTIVKIMVLPHEVGSPLRCESKVFGECLGGVTVW